MKSVLKKLFAPLALAVVLTGCAENPQDVARKPAVVEAMVQNSMDICNKGPVNGDAASYQARLREVLNNTRTKNLDEMQNHGITVCLDQRLSQQTKGFWDEGEKAVFYNNQNQSGIVSLWDNGTQPQDASFWHRDAYDYGSRDIARLAQKFRDGKVSTAYTTMYAGVESCGKNCSDIYWHDAQHFDKDTIAKNPELQKPPAPIPAPKAPGS